VQILIFVFDSIKPTKARVCKHWKTKR